MKVVYMTYDEYKELKKRAGESPYTYKGWLSGQDEEVKKKYREKRRESLRGHCEICDKECTNIYTHKKCKKHMDRENNLLEKK